LWCYFVSTSCRSLQTRSLR
ncbi:hypothetical protein D046_2753B, partial [Vibrio parahaemolyticus V-223/04]